MVYTHSSMVIDTGRISFVDASGEWGFIEPDCGEHRIFFHVNDGCEIYPGAKEPTFDPDSRIKDMPRVDDRVAYKVIKAPKGPKASPWGYEDEYERALNAIQMRPRYRVLQFLKVQPQDKPRKPVAEWGGKEGVTLAELCSRYPRNGNDTLRSGFIDNANVFHYVYSFQIRKDTGWEDCNDPRPLVIAKV